MRQIRQREQKLRALRFNLVELHRQLFDPLGAGAVGLEDGAGVLPLPFGARHFVAGRVLIPFQALGFRNETPPPGFQHSQRLELLVGIESAMAKPGADILGMLTDEFGSSMTGNHISCSTYEARPSLSRVRSRFQDIAEASLFERLFSGGRTRNPLFTPTKAQRKRCAPRRQAIIQYGCRRGGAIGCPHIILVTGRGKNAIEDHFDVAIELETFLESRGKLDLLDQIRKTPTSLFRVCQAGRAAGPRACSPRHARAGWQRALRRHSGRRRDRRGSAALRQMMTCSRRWTDPVLAVERVPMEQVSSYGIVAIEESDGLPEGVCRVKDLIEKPARAEAPSNLAIIGRYILTPDVFPALQRRPATGPARSAHQRPSALLRDRPSTPARSKASATTPATSSAICGRSYTSPFAAGSGHAFSQYLQSSISRTKSRVQTVLEF